jgi:integrase
MVGLWKLPSRFLCGYPADTRPADHIMNRLTDDFARSVPAPTALKSKIHYDGAVKGFGLRVTKAGARAFVLNYRADGVERRLTIGSYPDWKVSTARKEAMRLKRLVDQGEDPMGERHEDRAAPTMSDLCDRYLTDHAPRKRETSRREDAALIKRWIKPEFGTRKVSDIRHADVDALHRKITDHGTPTRANRTMALISKMFSLAVRWEMRADNPAKGIERNNEEARHRYLIGDELRRLIDALAAYPNQTSANAIRLLLLTGARRGEVLAARWDQFDLETGVWVKPSSHTKQKRLHRIPLSAGARLLLVEIKAAAGSSEFLFPSSLGTTGHLMDIKRAWASIRKLAGLDGVRTHDLRHSYASILASSGLSLPVIGALLGHTQASTTQRYAHLFDDPLRAATERVGVIVTAAGEDKPAAPIVRLKKGQ